MVKINYTHKNVFAKVLVIFMAIVQWPSIKIFENGWSQLIMVLNHNVLSVGELQEWLNKKVDIEEVKLTDYSDAFVKMLNYNALNCLLNNGAITDSTQLKFCLYHLRNTDQNAPYYNIPDSDSSPVPLR